MSEPTIPPDSDDRALEARAHVLYWNSDRSVNSIADEMGLSKGRLYGLIRPLSAGRTCPECQSDLVFENRTARDRDEAACPMCDGAKIPLTASGAPTGDSRAARFASGPASGSAAGEGRPGRATDGPALLGGETSGVVAGLLVGAAAGLLLGRFLRR